MGADKMLGRALIFHFAKKTQNDLLPIKQKEIDGHNLNEILLLLQKYAPYQVISLLGNSGGIALNQAIPADLMIDNLLTALNVMRACHQSNIQKAIFLGSSCMYPVNTSQPIQEHSLFENYLEPTSQPYAVAKLAAFQLCEAFNKQYGTNFIFAIPNSLYGPYDNFNPSSAHVVGALINKFHQAKLNQSEIVVLWGSGLPRRELIYVNDAARATARLLKNDITASINPINIGCGYDISIKNLAEMVANTVGFKGKIVWDSSKSDGVLQKWLDNSKLHELGWSAQTSLGKGLIFTYRWYLAHSMRRNMHDQIYV
ncbi:MAG: NAD-dependent epimerase/dehydratase family protein [Coxiella-like endosymbiont]